MFSLQNYIEYYDIEQDPYQMDNTINELHPAERHIFTLLLQNLTKCVGTKQCSNANL